MEKVTIGFFIIGVLIPLLIAFFIKQKAIVVDIDKKTLTKIKNALTRKNKRNK